MMSGDTGGSYCSVSKGDETWAKQKPDCRG